MNTMNNKPEPDIPFFVLKDCELIAIATHKHAGTLKEFRDHIDTLSSDSLYYHFWAHLLLPHFEELEYINDFASWTHHSLHDAKLGEQLAVLDPTSFNDLEESEYLQWFHATKRFEFIRSQIVVFNTHTQIREPHEMSALIPRMPASSLFYHFIDARRRTQDKIDDFRHWLAFFGETYQPLIDRLTGIHPYFNTPVDLRQLVAATFQNFLKEQAQ